MLSSNFYHAADRARSIAIVARLGKQAGAQPLDAAA